MLSFNTRLFSSTIISIMWWRFKCVNVRYLACCESSLLDGAGTARINSVHKMLSYENQWRPQFSTNHYMAVTSKRSDLSCVWRQMSCNALVWVDRRMLYITYKIALSRAALFNWPTDILAVCNLQLFFRENSSSGMIEQRLGPNGVRICCYILIMSIRVHRTIHSVEWFVTEE